tara:strand:+ start:4614 stop:4937 length:324 start_codon:yes stop_codon:yes gene_type:complete
MIVYLTVSNLDGVIDNSIIPLINARGNCGKIIESGDKWQDLKDGFLMRVGEVGRGDLIIKYKEGIEHWVLPFESHPEMTQPQNKNDAFVLDKEEFKSYGWDVPNDEI